MPMYDLYYVVTANGEEEQGVSRRKIPNLGPIWQY
jgi:hypothetical protein